MPSPVTAPTPGANDPAQSYQQEVRFAVVMYGGVSLAIYINGVAQELYSLVRATSGAKIDPADDPTAAIYQELSEHVRDVSSDGGGMPLRTRFVVDILSGTSAGGINAILSCQSHRNSSARSKESA